MMVVWKAPLGIGENNLLIPLGAQFLCVREQNRGDGNIFVWFKCQSHYSIVPRRIILYETGSDNIPDDGIYIDTVLLDNGRLVLHSFEVI